MTFGQRREPMKRGKELKRTGFKNRGKGLDRTKGNGLKRTGALKPMSDFMREEAAEKRIVREAVFERDGHKCRIAPFLPDDPCFGHLTVHHLWKSGQGGPYTEDNLITACSHHNDWVEDHVPEATALGLVRRPHG